MSSRTYEAYDLRYHHSWDLSADGDGIIRVHEPEQGELQLALPKPIDLRIERDVVEQLVNAYFSDVAPMLPVVTREEFIANNPPPPILLYAICLVAATRRNVPQMVFESIRYTVNSLIKAEDVLSTASIVNMQSLLVLAMVGDCHSQYVPHALSALWVRLGCAIRMVGCLLALLRQLFAYLAGCLHCTFRRRTWACTEPSLSTRTLRCADDCGGSVSLAIGGMCLLSEPRPCRKIQAQRSTATLTLTLRSG